jgi:hypothetical protein
VFRSPEIAAHSQMVLNEPLPIMKNANKPHFTTCFSIAAFLFGALALFTSQGCSNNPDSLAGYLPESASISPWKADGPPKLFKGNELYNYIDGGAGIFFEYGFIQMIAHRYTLGDNSITVDIYEMNHPKAAFGIYSVSRNFETPALEVGDAGTESDTMISFCQGRFYVAVTSNTPAIDVKQASVRFARAVSQKINTSSQLPDLLKMLPTEHLIPGSRGYVSGILGLNTQFYLGDNNILGINGQTVECVFGQYKIKQDQANLLVIRYPDSSRAESALSSAREAFTKKYTAADEKDITAFRDRRNRFYHISAEKNFLYVISRADSIDLIREMVSSIGSSTSNK